MEIVKRVYRRAAFVLIPAAALSALYDWRMMPISILVGGLLALINLKGLAWGLDGMLGTFQAAGRLVFLSMFRLILLVLAVVLLIYAGLVNIIGVFIGLTLVFMLIMVEGMKVAKMEAEAEEREGTDGGTNGG